MKVCVKCKGVVSVGGSRSTIERPPLLLLEMMVNAYAGVVALALDDLAEVMGIADHGGTPGIFFPMQRTGMFPINILHTIPL
jgi:hypothetical protein